jgi:hypothetical protein
MIDAVIAEQDGRIAGIGYPSRKQRGHQAFALSSRCRRAASACWRRR